MFKEQRMLKSMSNVVVVSAGGNHALYCMPGRALPLYPKNIVLYYLLVCHVLQPRAA
jgi:hypothetical protein